MHILVNDLKRHYEALAAELEAATLAVMRRGWYVLGPEVTLFEQEWAAWCGADTCVSVANGTEALQLALAAVGVEPGDEVLTVANAGGYTSCATRALRAFPRYVDVEPSSLTMDAALVEAQISSRTRAIVVVHLYGQVANLGALRAIADAHGLALIEDCAQAHGAYWHGRAVGSIGDVGCFSFYPTKNLGALGDGGAILTSNPEIAQRIRYLRTYGWDAKYTISVAQGINSRLDELQAAILRIKLRYLSLHNERRRTIAAHYAAALSELDIILPHAADPLSHVYHLYVIQVATEQRATVREALQAHGIGCDIHYPIADHQQPAWRDEYQGLHLPVTEAQTATVLSLPCYPELSDAEIEEVAAVVRAALRQV